MGKGLIIKIKGSILQTRSKFVLTTSYQDINFYVKKIIKRISPLRVGPPKTGGGEFSVNRYKPLQKQITLTPHPTKTGHHLSAVTTTIRILRILSVGVVS